MFGQETYIDKSMNGIKTITDGFTVIQNGNIETNNISTGVIDTSHINSDTGTFEDFTIQTMTVNDIDANNITADIISLNDDTDLTAPETDVIISYGGMTCNYANGQIHFYNKRVGNTMRAKLNLDLLSFWDENGVLVASLGISGVCKCSAIEFPDFHFFDWDKYLDTAKKSQNNTYTGINTFSNSTSFTTLQTDSATINLSASIGTIGSPFIATQNNQITTKKYVDDAINGIDYSNIPKLNGNNIFTGTNTYWNNLTVDGGSVGIIPTSQCVNGVITPTPTYIGNLLPNSADGRNYLGPDSFFGGDVNIAYDLEVNNSISNGGTIFTNTISNNSAPLSIVSLSGLTLQGPTNISTSLSTPQANISDLGVANSITFTGNTTIPSINSTSLNDLIITSANNTNLYLNNDKPTTGNLYINSFSPNSNTYVQNGDLNIENGDINITGNLNVSVLTKTSTLRASKLQNYNNILDTSNFLDIETITRRMDWRHYSIERKLILAIVWYNIRSPRMIPCSMRQMESYDDDDYWILEPGVKIEVYDGVDYSGLLTTFDNTNGIAPQMYIGTGAGASCKVYFFDEQIIYANISYIP